MADVLSSTVVLSRLSPLFLRWIFSRTTKDRQALEGKTEDEQVSPQLWLLGYLQGMHWAPNLSRSLGAWIWMSQHHAVHLQTHLNLSPTPIHYLRHPRSRLPNTIADSLYFFSFQKFKSSAPDSDSHLTLVPPFSATTSI